MNKENNNLEQDTIVPEKEIPEAVEEAAVQPSEQEAYQKEIAELKDKVLRKQAEFDNFRKRTRGEMEQLGTFVAAEVIRKFLPVLDNFGRALENENTEDVESLKKGMELIYRQMEKSLADAGAEKIPALGQQFSPDLHEAVMNGQNTELSDGQIDMVFEEGYKIKEKVIRHSKVRVVNNS